MQIKTATLESPSNTAREARTAVAQELARVLADSYTLYLQTHRYHWNVTGPQFFALHAMFEQQYQELAAAVDEIAERIRALGEVAPGSYAAFARLGTIADGPEAPHARVMLETLAQGNEAIQQTLRAALARAQQAGDDGSVDLMVRRLQVHQKNAWMLRSTLAQ